MSTKCQYQAAVSNPIWLTLLMSAVKKRIKHNHSKLKPTITCKPCNPVNKKKQQPKTESETLKGLIEYSEACIKTNNSPKIKQ